MKNRIIALFVCLLIISMAFVAQAESEYLQLEWEQLEQAVKEAARIEEMAKHYDTLKITYTDYNDDSIESIVYYDLKQDMVFRHIQADESVYMYIDNSLCGIAEDGKFCKVLVVGDVNIPIYYENGNLVYYEAADQGEILLGRHDLGDGVIAIDTCIPRNVTQAAFAFKGIEVGESEYYAEMLYLLDGETLAPLECEEALIDSEDDRNIRKLTFEYDVELSALDIAFGEYMAVTEDMRTVTVIADPDTEHEKAYSVESPRGDEVVFCNLSDSIYTDRECTEVYQGDDCSEDMTLYTRIFSK